MEMSSMELGPEISPAEFQSRMAFAVRAGDEDLIEATGGIVMSDVCSGSISVKGDALVLPVVLVACRDPSTFMKKRTDGADVRMFDCRIDDRIYPFLSLRNGDIELQVLTPKPELPKWWANNRGMQLLEELRYLGIALGGAAMVLHPPPLTGIHSPFRDEGNVFHVFIRTLPMPGVGDDYPEKLFDVDVETRDGYYSLPMPAKGRGVILSDGTTDVVQVIGHNIYVLINPFKLMQIGLDVGLALFRKSVVLALNHILATENTALVEVRMNDSEGPSLQEVTTLIETYAKDASGVYEAKIARALKNIHEAETELLRQKQELRQMKQLRDTLSANNFYGRTLTQRLTEDYARIIANPHVRGARIVLSTAIDISTDVIEMMHDGVRYKIGTFVIRFLLDGEVVIWTDESYHPNSIPHPHISPWTGPCFGNVGTTIEDAVVEFRFADALEYILEWLTNGYAPELVIYNKLEEWPVVGANARSEHATE